MAEANKPLYLPYVDIQRSAAQVERDILSGEVGAEDIWISVYQQQQTSVHGKIRCRGKAEGGLTYEARDGIELDKRSDGTFLISAPSLGVQNTPVRRSKRMTGQIGIETFDLSPVASSASTSFVSGGANGSLVFGQISLSNGQESISVQPKREHKSDITTARFFPSGQVVLTGSLDTTLRLWSFDKGTNPQTLKGHTRAITATSFLLPTKGREILSASLDGTLRHWDVSTGGGQLTSWDFPGGLTSVSSTADGNTSYVTTRSSSTKPISVTDLRSKEVSGSFSGPRNTSAQTIALASDEKKIAIGDAQGRIAFWDVRSKDAPLLQWERTEGAGINTLSFSGETLLVGGMDGLPYRAGIEGESVRVLEEFGAATEEEAEKIVRVIEKEAMLICCGARGWSIY